MARFIDTNVFVTCLRGRADHVRERFLAHSPAEILVPFQSPIILTNSPAFPG